MKDLVMCNTKKYILTLMIDFFLLIFCISAFKIPYIVISIVYCRMIHLVTTKTCEFLTWLSKIKSIIFVFYVILTYGLYLSFLYMNSQKKKVYQSLYGKAVENIPMAMVPAFYWISICSQSVLVLIKFLELETYVN